MSIEIEDRRELLERLRIMQRFVDGEEIKATCRDSNDPFWGTQSYTERPQWDWEFFDYEPTGGSWKCNKTRHYIGMVSIINHTDELMTIAKGLLLDMTIEYLIPGTGRWETAAVGRYEWTRSMVFRMPRDVDGDVLYLMGASLLDAIMERVLDTEYEERKNEK